MSEKNSEKQSQTDWEKLAKMTDEEIDTSDIPPLDNKFFADAELRMPKNKVSILVNVDQEISDWYEAQGVEGKNLMSVALRIYANAHRKETHR
jgi:uncharacterized protein (DUF4415 family)